MNIYFDMKILAVLVLVWAVINFLVGITQNQPDQVIKGALILIIAGYLYFSGSNIAIKYYKEEEDKK